MVNAGPWVFINAPPGGDVDGGGSWVSIKAGVCGKSLCLPFDFTVSLKPLKNMKSLRGASYGGWRMGVGGVRGAALA